MPPDATISLIGYLGIIALILLGLRIILTGLKGGAGSMAPPTGFGRGVFGRTVTSLLNFTVAFKFFFESYSGKVYDYETVMAMALFALLAMALLPVVETLVALAALTVFLINNTATFGPLALGTFLGLLLLFSFLRWIIGR